MRNEAINNVRTLYEIEIATAISKLGFDLSNRDFHVGFVIQIYLFYGHFGKSRKQECECITVNAMQNDINTESQTAFIGTSFLFTLCHSVDNGIAPSLENAYAILNFAEG